MRKAPASSGAFSFCRLRTPALPRPQIFQTISKKIDGSILRSVLDLVGKTLTRPEPPARLSQEIRTMSLITRFLRDDSGATAIEYGLIAAGISVAIIATVTSLGGKLVTTFGKVDTALN
jgi:pilus assembly protein Flp/PilA